MDIPYATSSEKNCVFCGTTMKPFGIKGHKYVLCALKEPINLTEEPKINAYGHISALACPECGFLAFFDYDLFRYQHK